MQADHWKIIEELYQAAALLPREKRAAFLQERCPGDPDLQAEVESLLRAADTGDSLLDGSPLSSIMERQPALQPGAAARREAGLVRDPGTHRQGRDGRGVPRARRAAQARRGYQGVAA